MAAPFPSLYSPLPPHHSQKVFLLVFHEHLRNHFHLPLLFPAFPWGRGLCCLLATFFLYLCPGVHTPIAQECSVKSSILSLLYLQPLLCLFTLPLPFFWHKVQITPILFKKKNGEHQNLPGFCCGHLPSQLSWKTVTLLFVITSSMCVYSSVCGVWLPPTIPDHCTGRHWWGPQCAR